jgi:hypothetical protein
LIGVSIAANSSSDESKSDSLLTTLYVDWSGPDNYSTIQSAIDVASIDENILKNNHKRTEKEWTWIFYDDAEGFASGDPMNPPEVYINYSIFNTLYSGDNLNVLVLQDTFLKPAKLWYINENKENILLQDMGEINMGDGKTLYEFITYAKNNFPAKRYLLSFYGHGAGWGGACGDRFGTDFLTMDEMQVAISTAGNVDIICFTAPCLMGAVESIYELRDCTDVYVASQEVSMYLYWMNSMENIRDLLDYDLNLSNVEIGKQIIEFIEEDHVDDELITMSAIRTDKIEELIVNIDNLAKYLIDNTKYYKELEIIYEDIEFFGYGGSVDLYDFCRLMNNTFSNETITSLFQEIKDSLLYCVIANYHGLEHENAHGMTIFLPNQITKYFTVIRYRAPLLNLDFAQNTYWDEFIKDYIIKK